MIKWHVCVQERTLGVHMKATESALIANNVTVLMSLVFVKNREKALRLFSERLFSRRGPLDYFMSKSHRTNGCYLRHNRNGKFRCVKYELQGHLFLRRRKFQ